MAVTAGERTKSRRDFSGATKKALNEKSEKVEPIPVQNEPKEEAVETVKAPAEQVKESEKQPEAKKTASATPKKKKKTAGRPAGEPTYKINLAIPEALKGDIDAAALMYKGSVTGYINSLIKKDIEENGKKYREFKNLIGE